jgi:hypothetical protein
MIPYSRVTTRMGAHDLAELERVGYAATIARENDTADMPWPSTSLGTS